jgi:hypothetical protein
VEAEIMTDILLLMCVPTTILLALTVDAIIAIDLMWDAGRC